MINYTTYDNSKKVDNDGNGLCSTGEDEVYAKRTSEEGGYFYIRVDASKNPYDPFSPTQESRDLKRIYDQNPDKHFTKVSEECFNHYLTFLRTKSKVSYSYTLRTL